jgi:hypothetical protein
MNFRTGAHFEWTFSSCARERECSGCREKTSGFLTSINTGSRKPLCSTCFLLKLKSPGGLQGHALKLTTGVEQMKNAIYRQGDVLIRRVKSLPAQKAQLRLTGILAYGEVTGHAHRLEDLAKAEVLEVGKKGLFLRVGGEGVRIIHEEHAPVELPAGNYEIEIQREYTPAEIRNVVD